MKLGMNLFLWTNRFEPKHFALLPVLKKAGFDGVEIPSSDYSANELKIIRSALDSNGLVCTVATLLTAENDPIAEDLKLRKAALEKLNVDIAVAESLGAETLVGPIHSAHKVFPGRGPNEEEFERCVEFFRAVGPIARQANVKLSIEGLNRFECYFLNTTEQGKRLIDTIDLSNVGYLYDTHHAHIEERDIYDAVTLLGSRINHFHVSESHRGTPGTGLVDWESNFRGLKDINYDGWVVIEAFATDVVGIPQAVNIWRNCFADKTEVFTKGIELIRSHT